MNTRKQTSKKLVIYPLAAFLLLVCFLYSFHTARILKAEQDITSGRLVTSSVCSIKKTVSVWSLTAKEQHNSTTQKNLDSGHFSASPVAKCAMIFLPKVFSYQTSELSAARRSKASRTGLSLRSPPLILLSTR